MPQNHLTVSLVQYAPRWEDIPHNLSRLAGMMQPLSGKTDLIVLPEMFPTGFSMDACRSGNSSHVAVLSWMRQEALSTKAMIAGSMATMAGGRCYNRFCWVDPDGNDGYYDKRHLFTMSDEPLHFTAGTEQKRFNLSGWEIKPIVCYDLRFPVWCRNSRTRPYDLLLCPASWPATRSDAWLTLLKARALENQCYVVGVNRVGTDRTGVHHKGDSVVYGPKGEIIGKLQDNQEEIASFRLPYNTLHEFRTKFPVLDDMDEAMVLKISSEE